jgi:hypothetical protein
MSAYPNAAAMAAAAAANAIDGVPGHVTPGRYPPMPPGEPGNFLVARKFYLHFYSSYNLIK